MPYRTSPIPQAPPAPVPRWQRVVAWLDAEIGATWPWYRREKGGRWSPPLDPPPLSGCYGWTRVDRCPGRWSLFDIADLRRAPPLVRCDATAQNARALRCRAGCVCEVHP